MNNTLIKRFNQVRLAPGKLALSYLGQHSFILKLGDAVIYIDPYLTPDRARLIAPVLSPQEITNATLITGSHDHGDHIDHPAWPVLAAASPDAVFVVPEAVRQAVGEATGIVPERIRGLNDSGQLKIAGVTITAVAAAVNCSVAAASTVLNGSKGNTAVGDEMRKKILAAADEMGYRPNFASQILKTRCSRTLGIYVEPSPWRGIGYSYEMEILKGIEAGARARGYDLLLLNMGAQVLPKVCGDYLAGSRIDGILLLHADSDSAWVDELVDSGHPVVAIDCCSEKTKLNRVIFDNEAAVRLTVETLVELGHRRIGFVGCCTEAGLPEDEFRETCFRRIVRELGLPDGDELIFNQVLCSPPISAQSEYCQLEGAAALRYFSAMKQPPSAIVAYNSLVGFSILCEARKQKVRIPETFSVIGFDDNMYFDLVEPGLAVIDHILPEMGESGAELLMDIIENKVEGPLARIFQPKLIRRDSIQKYSF